MRLAVIQPEQPHVGQIAHQNLRMFGLKLAEDGHQRIRRPVIAVTTNSPDTISPWPFMRLASWPNCSSVVWATDSRSRPASVGV